VCLPVASAHNLPPPPPIDCLLFRYGPCGWLHVCIINASIKFNWTTHLYWHLLFNNVPHVMQTHNNVCQFYVCVYMVLLPLTLHVHHHHHHHHRVARPWQDIAVSMSLRYLERSCARFQVEFIPRLCCWRSSSIVRSQVSWHCMLGNRKVPLL